MVNGSPQKSPYILSTDKKDEHFFDFTDCEHTDRVEDENNTSPIRAQWISIKRLIKYSVVKHRLCGVSTRKFSKADKPAR